MITGSRRAVTDGFDYSGIFDVAIIGAGVVGCALARRFTLAGARVLTLEKSSDIIDGASKGNSGILHTGFDAPPGSIEHRCIRAGYQEYRQIHERLNLPLLNTGALVLAWTEQDAARLSAIMQQAQDNDVPDIEQLSAQQITALEPQLANSVKAGLRITHEAIIDPWSAPYAYLLQALENGAHLLRHTEVIDGQFDHRHWHLKTSNGDIKATTVINCAGLYGDQIDERLLGQSTFTIRPRKGQFLVFDKAARELLQHIMLPIPSATTKGIVICPTIYGNILVGPTAEEQDSRSDTAVDSNTLQMLYDNSIRMLPALAQHSITATYAGLRPATQFKDYCIRCHNDHNLISVGGIRSTGLSAALGIARYVYELYQDMGHQHQAIDDHQQVWPQLSSLAEHANRDWMRSGNDGIVCHCELVTRREIQHALSGPLAARSLAGLKRRTRATMGRCQGFYCSATLSELTADHFANPISEPMQAQP